MTSDTVSGMVTIFIVNIKVYCKKKFTVILKKKSETPEKVRQIKVKSVQLESV